MLDALPSLAALAASLQNGSLLAVDLVQFCLQRIEQHEKRILAWVEIAEDALDQANRADEAAARGESLGPLHGIPFGVKDIFDVAGRPTRAGSPLRQGHIAKQDADLVAQLRAAGAIVLGKTVTAQWACFDPPATRNPWNVRHTPGGSSSGSAAAVALSMVPFAIGSQTGGSITRPASYCGAAGLKPTLGAISSTGMLPVSKTLDHPGFFARTAADLALIAFAVGLLPELPQPHLALPLVRLRGFFEQDADMESHAITSDVSEKLSSLFPWLPPSELPACFEQVHVMHRRIMAVEAADVHRIAFAKQPDQFGPQVASLIEEGLATSAESYTEALAHRRWFQAELLEKMSAALLVTPATPAPAPEDLTSTGDPRFNSPWSYCGWPTVSIPCALAKNGMPVSLQLIDRPRCEARLLSAAAALEMHLSFAPL